MQTFENIEVVVCLRDEKYERPLRVRFSKAMPDAHIQVTSGEPSAYADLISVSGEMEGTEKPLVKAQEVVGEFNADVRRRSESGKS